MGDPPNGSTSIGLKWDRTKYKTFLTTGSKYLVMSRINSEETLKNVSPFLIKKAIDTTCYDQIEECKKMRNGNILIKTKNNTQASKLLTLTALSNTIQIEVSEHKTLNYSKGIIYCNDLRGISEEEILSELQPQHVTEVKKIRKKVNETLTETGLICLTFATTTLPIQINVGYQKINIREYIPLPMRCNNCFAYGHTAKYCSSPKICYNCSQPHHLDNIMTTCVLDKQCSNCKTADLTPDNHAPTSKQCPIFIKQKEVQAIKTMQKVDKRTALKIYNERHLNNAQSFASALQSKATTTTAQVKINETTASTPYNLRSSTRADKLSSTKRPLKSYSDLSDEIELDST